MVTLCQCKVTDCDKSVRMSKGKKKSNYCSTHEHRMYRHGTSEIPAPTDICLSEGCSRRTNRSKDPDYCWEHSEDGTRFLLRKKARRLGVNPDDVEKYFNDHDGLCDICDNPQSDKRFETLCIDHDHETGELRGLLCSKCNMAVGLLDDNPDLLRTAADYLELIRGVD